MIASDAASAEAHATGLRSAAKHPVVERADALGPNLSKLAGAVECAADTREVAERVTNRSHRDCTVVPGNAVIIELRFEGAIDVADGPTRLERNCVGTGPQWRLGTGSRGAWAFRELSALAAWLSCTYATQLVLFAFSEPWPETASWW